MESANVAVHITRSGLQKNIQRLPDGFLRRVQVTPELRITTRKVVMPEVTLEHSPTRRGGESVLIEQPGLPRVGISTFSRVNYVALPDGILLMVTEAMHCLLVAGVNATIVTSDGLLFAGQLRTLGDLLGIKGEVI